MKQRNPFEWSWMVRLQSLKTWFLKEILEFWDGEYDIDESVWWTMLFFERCLRWQMSLRRLWRSLPFLPVRTALCENRAITDLTNFENPAAPNEVGHESVFWESGIQAQREIEQNNSHRNSWDLSIPITILNRNEWQRTPSRFAISGAQGHSPQRIQEGSAGQHSPESSSPRALSYFLLID